ncbi:MAG: tetratricopeptide repeat protein, partial [Bacteroidota bacterium]|nr:tetratricopeptide repeat protein [Bacteroidota bacterium]
EYLEKAIIIREKVLPENHPNLASSYKNIALTYYSLKQYKKAKYYIDMAVAIFVKALPAESMYVDSAKGWQEIIENTI